MPSGVENDDPTPGVDTGAGNGRIPVPQGLALGGGVRLFTVFYWIVDNQTIMDDHPFYISVFLISRICSGDRVSAYEAVIAVHLEVIDARRSGSCVLWNTV